MDSKRKHHAITNTATNEPNTRHRPLTLRDLIPPKTIHKNSRAVRAGDILRAEYLPTIVNDADTADNEALESLDWTAVIARCKSHPFEAGESYFVRSSPSKEDAPAAIGSNADDGEDAILTYKPLHAMLKYDPPMEAVEAVVRAHPLAALDMTFEGTALKIAVESKVQNMCILRLLLVAEMAMRKKVLMESAQYRERQKANNDDSPKKDLVGIDLISVIPSPSSPERLFVGHNPIRWISESHVPRRTAALLLKWYPVGAFQRPRDEDGLPFEEIEQDYHDEDAMYSDSPLIEIVDDFARDQDVAMEGHDQNEVVQDDSDSDEDELEDGQQQASILPRRRRTFAEREYARKERRWEKFLHILYATDKILMSLKSTDGSRDESRANSSTAASANRSNIQEASTSGSSLNNNSDTVQSPRFHPVHAWIRIITNPHLGLEICRPYGVWSILRAMGQRIPSEFTAKDESDSNRSVFQTLAESPASNCRLCAEEIRDIVECLMDADYKSAHLPRRSDGRLIVHVALENGWPCRDILSRKTSATCA